MTNNDLKKMNRQELIELLLEQTVLREQAEEELQKTREDLEQQVAELKAQLEDRTIRLQDSGSIAEAALQLSGIFEAAQRAADDYFQSTRVQLANREAQLAKQEAESGERLRKAEEETQKRCERMLAEAESSASIYWNDMEQRLTRFCESHAEVRRMLGRFGGQSDQ